MELGEQTIKTGLSVGDISLKNQNSVKQQATYTKTKKKVQTAQ